jgi:two-component system NtrC family sensor kinase
MKSPLNILLLEDDPFAEALIRASLSGEGVASEMVRVETREAYLAAVERNGLDLVLSDYSLPSFDGLSALKIAQAKLPDTPFIFVSGKMGEELAIETLKSGATDYVLKDRMSRLPSAVRRAMSEADERAARREAERSRAEAWEMEALLMEASTDATLIAGSDRLIKRVNRQMEVMFGYTHDELIGQPVEMLLPERHRAGQPQDVAALGPSPKTRRMSEKRGLLGLRKGGEEFPAAIALSPMKTKLGSFLVATIRDITEAKRAEDELAHRAQELASANQQLREEQAERQKVETELRLAQKLEAIGQLSAGIAHEINTPMQFIGDSVHFLRQSFEGLLRLLDAHQEARYAVVNGSGPAEVSARIAEIEEETDLDYLRERVPRALDRTLEGIERVTSIVRAMKEFSHPHSAAKGPTDVNRALTNALMVSRNEYKYLADVETDFGAIPQVVCHAGELNQVFLNLIVNAAHAIGDSVEGTDRKGLIRVRTTTEGQAVMIQIQDTGTGIPDEIQDRIFNPFFTTKPVGKGTGQGLAIAHSIIVGKHGGALTFKSVVGRGTTFEIRLPVIPAEEVVA